MRKVLVALIVALVCGSTAQARSNSIAISPNMKSPCVGTPMIAQQPAPAPRYLVCGVTTYLVDERDNVISNAWYDKFQRLQNGSWVGKQGALFYLLRNGQPISYGYHRIVPIKNGYRTELGAFRFILNTNGQVVPQH